PFGAMDCGADWAHYLARSVLALLARDRLVVNRWILGAALVVHIHPQPLHLPAAHGLLLAYDGNIVLRLASYDAGFAANARVHVDGHAPLQLGVLIVGVERHLRPRRLDSFVREVGVLDEILQGRFANNVTVAERLGAVRKIGMVDVLETLRVSEPVSRTGFADFGSRHPGRIASANLIEVESHAIADATRLGASIAQENRDRVVGMSGLRPDRPLLLASIDVDLNDVAGRQPLLLGGVRADQNGVVPTEISDRLRVLLEPAMVGPATVVDQRVAAEDDLHRFATAAVIVVARRDVST